VSAASPVQPKRGRARELWGIILLPLIAIVLALIVGAIVILASELILGGRTFDPFLPFIAYGALLEGAFGGFDPVVGTLVATTPLVLGGLAVAVGFKAGLFNIGAQGQFLMGALGSVAAGVAVADQPPIVAIPIAVLAGTAAGGLWGLIPGALKALSGAHEVVTTIMLNYVAISVLATLVSGPLKVPNSPSPVTFGVGNAAYPVLIGRNGHLGILVAVVAVVVVWWLLYRTTRGFEIRTVGANPDAARYAGMRPRLIVALTMTLCGMLAGLAGTGVVLGITHQMTSSFGTTVGFDSIAVALLARSNPFGILPAALLFGAMRGGAGLMQIKAGIPVELVDVVQATILLVLVATPVIRRLLRLRGTPAAIEAAPTITKSYSGETVVR
jgi:general nucleoside transport system permease protein